MVKLPADVYDTLEFSALVFGGIGADLLVEEGGQFDVGDAIALTPYCLFGHAGFATAARDSFNNPLAMVLERAFPDDAVDANNTAVRAINQRKRRNAIARVTWKEYTRELNIVRGDS